MKKLIIAAMVAGAFSTGVADAAKRNMTQQEYNFNMACTENQQYTIGYGSGYVLSGIKGVLMAEPDQEPEVGQAKLLFRALRTGDSSTIKKLAFLLRKEDKRIDTSVFVKTYDAVVNFYNEIGQLPEVEDLFENNSPSFANPIELCSGV